MEKIIPFKKDIIFKTNLSEITSISLEHNLRKQDQYLITGSFTISGEYKMAEDSVILDSFSYDLPFDINIDERYDTDKMVIDIDDFYYEIINDNVLSVSIDVLLSNLEEIPEEESETMILEDSMMETEEHIVEDIEPVREEKAIETTEKIEPVKEELESLQQPFKELITTEKRCIEAEDSSLFDNIDTSESYRSYKVYIVREGDTLEKIMENYHISKEELATYNDLSELKLNDKIIIPAIVDEVI